MQTKTVAMMALAGCAIAILAGCGVPKEEHDKLVAQITADREASEASLNGKINDLESLLKAEKAKVQSVRLQLDDANERCKALQRQSAEAESVLADEKSKTAQLEQDIASAKSSETLAVDQAQKAEAKYNKLNAEYKALQRRFEMYKANMMGMGVTPSTSAKPSTSTKPSTSSTPKTSLDILGEMGSK